LIIKCVAIGTIPIHSATNKLNRLNTKCNVSPIRTIPDTKYLKLLNAILELNPIDKILPIKNILANI
jgi:hypothetical protein